MMMSPFSSTGSSASIVWSTAAPALTMIITRRGFLRLSASSCSEWQPIRRLPAPRPFTKASTFSTVRLKQATV
ncbi:MAG: hypothetical protein BWX70_03492 [Verrucomicrobia bacterium ADurb.Bin070]|nr:MAG: hypothetical protein BWX70_03492 [Verrucomicrobia bacterium ADurb.Bin070]